MRLSIISLCLVLSIGASSQELSIENTYEFTSLKKDSYLGNVSYNADDNTTTLYYVEKDVLQTVFTNYVFDENLDFVREEIEKFNIIDAFKGDATVDDQGNYSGDLRSVRERYPWFEYRGETYTKEMVYVNPSWGGKLVARKVVYDYTYNWNFGTYTRKLESSEKRTITGTDDDRIFLYDRYNNSNTGEVFLLVGIKAPKGDKANKWQHTMKFQILKINGDFEVEELEKIEFDHPMAIGYMDVLSRNREANYEGENDIMDVSMGNAAIVFSPVKSLFTKKLTDPDPGNHVMVTVSPEGKIVDKIAMKPETSGWIIEDYVMSADGKDTYFFGPAKEDAYVNSLQPTNSPLTGRTEIKEIKYKDFQVMKISDGQLAWIKATNLDEFSAKSVTPPSQKKSPEYKGKLFERAMVYVTPSGELFLSGQKYTMESIPDPNNPEKRIDVVDSYKDLVMFHFDNTGTLKSQYGIKRDKNNKYSKAILTPQEVALSADGKSIYWTYGELKGMRKGIEIGGGLLELAGVSTLSKKKLLYYPAVARIDLIAGSIGDFVALGADVDGKQVYYTNPEFPSLISPDGSTLTFVGEDKKGKVVWLGRMNLK